jgi:hypothetical protein
VLGDSLVALVLMRRSAAVGAPAARAAAAPA